MDKRSQCKNSYLHRWEIVQVYQEGVRERCEICNKVKFFKTNIANKDYLGFHNRQALQPNNKLFTHEYPNATTN